MELAGSLACIRSPNDELEPNPSVERRKEGSYGPAFHPCKCLVSTKTLLIIYLLPATGNHRHQNDNYVGDGIQRGIPAPAIHRSSHQLL